jgi:IS30 family transposase
MGKDGRSAIATLVERKTRFVMLVRLGRNRTAEEVRKALTERILGLPEQLRRTLTWDRGREMAQHARFSVDTNVKVYFCDPHSPWQRGSNENTNGLLRQYFPKGTPLSGYTQQELDDVAHELNGRPRMTLRWKNPAQAFAQAVAMTA